VAITDHPINESPRGRPRSLEADAAIRRATLELLRSEGFGSLTMASVAARAGVSTATLYRRWSSKVDLIVGALAAQSAELTVPDTGSLEGDIRAVLSDFLRARRRSADEDRLLAGLVSEMAHNPELAESVRETLIQPRRRAMAAMLERAETRGDCRAGVDHDLVMDLIFAPLQHRVLITGQPVTQRLVDALVDLVVRAAAPESASKETS
jgi:AcrR family transcriptional regulator